MVRKTRKQSKKSTAMTIPQLRKAFDHINKFVSKAGNTLEGFRKEWKKTFGKEVSVKAAQDYLNWLTLTKKKQSGGAAVHLSPASLDYALTPGGNNVGSYPEYIEGGFGFANVEQRIATPPAPTIGGKRRKTIKNKQKGGAFLDTLFGNNSEAVSRFSELVSRPFVNTSSSPSMLASGFAPVNPTGMGTDMQMLSKGYNGLSSPRPETHNFTYLAKQPIYAAHVTASGRL